MPDWADDWFAPHQARTFLKQVKQLRRQCPVQSPPMKWQQRKRLITRRGLLYSLLLCLLILGLGGVGFWILEPDAITLSDGLWLAFTTAATVGYGDIVPSTHASRAFSVLVVLLGLAVLSLVTASVAAMFIETEERQVERDLMDEIGALRAEVRSLHDDVRELKAPRPHSGRD